MLKSVILIISFLLLTVFATTMHAQNDFLKPGEVQWADTTKIRIEKEKQKWKAKNSVFVELFGPVGEEGFITCNYDRLLTQSKGLRTSLRIGGNIPRKKSAYFNAFPIMFNFYIGKEPFVELGIGGVAIYENLDYKVCYGAITSYFGFRYQKPKGGLFARVGFTPTYGLINGYIWFGSIAAASLGYCF